MTNWVRWVNFIGMDDLPSVGGRNASLGEMRRALTPLGIRTPDGFATTADAYRAFVRAADLDGQIEDSFRHLDVDKIDRLQAAGGRVRSAILAAALPDALIQAVSDGYHRPEGEYGSNCDVAVRSSEEGGTRHTRSVPVSRDDRERFVLSDDDILTLASNVTLAKEFAEVFDGLSIGSNDLTRLVPGVDRDSELVAHLFDERSEAVKRTIAQVIVAAHAAGRTFGIRGQAPSDYPELARFLVAEDIVSLSLDPDSQLQTMPAIVGLEKRCARRTPETASVGRQASR